MRGGTSEPAVPPSLPKREGGPDRVASTALPCLPHAQAYPIAVDAGSIAERTVTAQACPARLTHTLAHGAASPVCKEGEGRGEGRHICTCSPGCPPAGKGLQELPWELGCLQLGRRATSTWFPWNLLLTSCSILPFSLLLCSQSSHPPNTHPIIGSLFETLE